MIFRRCFSRYAALASLVFVLAPMAPAAADGNTLDAYQLAAGDTIRVVVFGHEDLSGDFEIDSSGGVSLPLIRKVDAAGRTKAEVEALIAERLRPDYLKNPKVSVEVINYRPIYVLGEVREPGSYPYAANLTVVSAIAMAGGYTYRASRKKIVVIKANDPDRQKRPGDEGDELSPGDVIEVPERFF